MNTNSSSDLDDFDTVPGIQPSGQFLASDVPGLSRDDLYDWEYDDDDDQVPGIASRSQNAGLFNQAQLQASRPIYQATTTHAQSAGAGMSASAGSLSSP